jgi:hypothetical protein
MVKTNGHANGSKNHPLSVGQLNSFSPGIRPEPSHIKPDSTSPATMLRRAGGRTHREHREQGNVKRRDVEIVRLRCEQTPKQHALDRLPYDRLKDHNGQPEISARDLDNGKRQKEQPDLGQVELPAALADPPKSAPKAISIDGAALRAEP